MAKRSLLSEAQLKAYLKGKVSGKCFHYQIYRTLKERGPSTVNDIIRDWKARLPRMGDTVGSTTSISQRLARVSWIEGDYSNQRKYNSERQVIWRLKLSEDFYEEVNTGEEE